MRLPGRERVSRCEGAAAATLFLLLTAGLLWVGYQSRIVPQTPRRAEGHSISPAPSALRLSTPEERQTLNVSFFEGAAILAEPVPIAFLAPIPDAPSPRQPSGPQPAGLRAPPNSLS